MTVRHRQNNLQAIQIKRSVQLSLCSSHLYTTNANHREQVSTNILFNMKSYITTTIFAVLCFFTQEAKGKFVSYNQIENGDYEATVYYSSTTGQKSTYTLVVTVLNDAVTKIKFDNNGSVHTGYNNEGYSYSGGSLSFSRNFEREITGASTTVKVKYPNGTVQKFQIEI